MLLPITTSQSILDPIFKALPGLYLIMKPDLSIVDATDAYLKTTKASREAMLGKYFFDVFPNNPATPDQNSAQEFEESLRYVIREKQPHYMAVLRYDLPVQDNLNYNFETRYWSPANYPIFDETGELIYILHEARDITEKVLSEEAQKHHYERLHLLTSALNAVAWEYDMINNKLLWGKGLKELFGYSPEDMGPGGESWDSRVHPDDFEQLQQSINEASSLGKKIWTGEYRFRKADGTYAHVLDQGYIVYNSHQKPVRTFGSIIDLTHGKRIEEDLRESDARFRHLLENLPHMACIADPKGKILYFNDNWYSFTGMKPGQKEGWINAVHPEDSADALTSWHGALNTGSLYELELRLKCSIDNSYRTVLQRNVPMQDQDSQVKLWICTYTDIEEQKQTLEKVRLKDQKMDKILKLSPAHLCMLEGPDLICTYASPGIYNMYGNRSFTGEPASKLWQDDFDTLQRINQAYTTKECLTLNSFPILFDRCLNGKTEETYFNLKFQPISDNEGQVDGVLLSAVEVTEAVEAKRMAEKMALKLQELI
jgi:PAS domain S-box-containing protein